MRCGRAPSSPTTSAICHVCEGANRAIALEGGQEAVQRRLQVAVRERSIPGLRLEHAEVSQHRRHQPQPAAQFVAVDFVTSERAGRSQTLHGIRCLGHCAQHRYCGIPCLDVGLGVPLERARETALGQGRGGVRIVLSEAMIAHQHLRDVAGAERPEPDPLAS